MAAVKAANEFRRRHTGDAVGALLFALAGALLSALGQESHRAVVQTVGVLIQLAGGLMAAGALMRLAFADEHPGEAVFRPGRFGLQWGAPEWRLLGAGVLLGLICSLAFLAAMVVGFGFGAALGFWLAEGRDSVITIAVEWGIGLGFLGAFYVGIRLILSAPATISLQRVTVLKVWPLTRGQVWPILAAVALIVLILFAVAMLPLLLSAVAVAAVVWASHGDREMAGLLGALIGTLVAGLVVNFGQIPLLVGLYAHLYRGLRPAADAGQGGHFPQQGNL
ncbi:MAG TPA: hypothetical protein VL358_14210 [Caulobacteraceae bacterium]|jgi:hypothetical protein|nr:hypothetical protein [Caulobacteraceae bacterium]